MKKRIALANIVICMLAVSSYALVPPIPQIKYLGHASFLIDDFVNATIMIDPFDKLGYPPPNASADIVTVSHEHFDHNNVAAVKGNPTVLRGLKPDGSWNEIDTVVHGIHIRNVGVYHDEEKGAKRGLNSVFIFDVSGIIVVHMGDLGHTLDEKTIKKIGKPDFLLIPVGGFYTIDDKAAWKVIEQLKPGCVIPMHYKTSKTEKLPIQTADPFLKDAKNLKSLTRLTADLDKQMNPAVWLFPTP